ncbi:hypothetical protein TPENAI_60781 [Tenacibaculum litopenaei]
MYSHLEVLSIRMKNLVVLFLFILTVSCFESTKQTIAIAKKDGAIKSREQSKDDVSFDSKSLKTFWKEFKDSLKNGNTEYVSGVMNYPIRGIYPVIFKYSHDCDTISYDKNSEKFISLSISKKNFNKYYDFVFSDVLKEIIYQTDYRDLIKRGTRNNCHVSQRCIPKTELIE